MFDSYSKLITAGKSLDGDGRERIKFIRLSVRLLCVPADAVTPDTPLSLLCLHGHGASLIRHSNVIINPDGKCHIKQESRESTLHIL